VLFGFIGPSGCGKTTTIRLLTGFYKPTSGTAKVLGHQPMRFTAGTRARIGYMPQRFALYPNLTVWENLNFAASIYGVDFRREARLRKLLDFVELEAHKSKKTYNLSGGMRRRLSLATTLVHDPDLIFLDEPTAAIDPLLRQKLWDHFRKLQNQGRTLFITTQYVSEAAYCDLVGLLVKGRLLTLDSPAALRQQAFGGDAIDLRTAVPLDAAEVGLLKEFPFVKEIQRVDDHSMRIIVSEAGTALPTLVEWNADRGIDVESIEEYLPPFDQVFVQLVKLHSS
jgi:ABC-2 type transport system ATP-binding protein